MNRLFKYCKSFILSDNMFVPHALCLPTSVLWWGLYLTSCTLPTNERPLHKAAYDMMRSAYALTNQCSIQEAVCDTMYSAYQSVLH